MKNCKDFSMKNGILHCKAMKEDGEYVETSIDTNKILGAVHGKFYTGMDLWSKRARSVNMIGTELHAELKGRNGEYVEDSIDLGPLLENQNGELKYAKGVKVVDVRKLFDNYPYQGKYPTLRDKNGVCPGTFL